jgi:hypothetical protein
MKRKILICILGLLAVFSVEAQQWTNFIQAGAGINLKDTKEYMFQVEYGKTYKWLDVSLSLDYESMGLSLDEYASGRAMFDENGLAAIITNDFSYMTLLSLRLNARVDFIHLLYGKSRHAFKAGLGCGYTRKLDSFAGSPPKNINLEDNVVESWGMGTDVSHFYLMDLSLRMSYEYAVTEKVSLGAFFYAYQWVNWGLSLRRNF